LHSRFSGFCHNLQSIRKNDFVHRRFGGSITYSLQNPEEQEKILASKKIGDPYLFP